VRTTRISAAAALCVCLAGFFVAANGAPAVEAASRSLLARQTEADRVAQEIDGNAAERAALIRALARNDAAAAAQILARNGLPTVTARMLRFNAGLFRAQPEAGGGPVATPAGRAPVRCRIRIKYTRTPDGAIYVQIDIIC